MGDAPAGLERIQALLQERRRAVARSSLQEYCRLLWPDELAALHHRLILSALQDAVTGVSPRVVILAPPGSAKSSYASIRFPSWFRGKYPKADLIAASHTQELADKFGRRVRNTCQSEEWREIWSGVEVSGDSSAVNRWTTNAGGEYFGVGVGGTVVGRRAGGFLGDDVSGGITDAMTSKVTRDAVWDWYVGDLLPRLKPNAWQVVIGTRFHSEDFIGRIIQQHDAGIEQWRIISLPMLAEKDDVLGREEGELLWPDYFNDEMVRIARRNNDTWMALYQQRPIVESGQYFKREWVREFDAGADGWPVVRTVEGVSLLKNLTVYGVSDYAVTHGGGDYTVHLIAGVAEDGKIYLLDMWRAQADPSVWISELVRLAETWKPMEWFEEKGQIAKGHGSFITKALNDRQCYLYRSQHAMPRGADGLNSKQVGAQSIRGRMAQGMVWFPRGAWWMADCLSEMMAFPTEKSGVHDDIVDCLSLLGRALDRMVEANEVVRTVPPDLLAQPTFKDIFWDMSRERRRQRI